MDNQFMLMILVMMICIVMLCALGFLAQCGCFFWLFFRGLANSAIYEAATKKLDKTSKVERVSEQEKSEIGGRKK